MALELQAFVKEERIPAILAVLTLDSPNLDVLPVWSDLSKTGTTV